MTIESSHQTGESSIIHSKAESPQEGLSVNVDPYKLIGLIAKGASLAPIELQNVKNCLIFIGAGGPIYKQVDEEIRDAILKILR